MLRGSSKGVEPDLHRGIAASPPERKDNKHNLHRCIVFFHVPVQASTGSLGPRI